MFELPALLLPTRSGWVGEKLKEFGSQQLKTVDFAKLGITEREVEHELAERNSRRMARLKATHTRELLFLFRVLSDIGYDPSEMPPFSVEEVKAELNTREHVPNKKESLALRKQKIKTRSPKDRGRPKRR